MTLIYHPCCLAGSWNSILNALIGFTLLLGLTFLMAPVTYVSQLDEQGEGRPACAHALSVVQVLTTGSWPGEVAGKCELPQEAEACCEAFKNFYLRKYSGRRLTWQTNKGHAGALENAYR